MPSYRHGSLKRIIFHFSLHGYDYTNARLDVPILSHRIVHTLSGISYLYVERLISCCDEPVGALRGSHRHIVTSSHQEGEEGNGTGPEDEVLVIPCVNTYNLEKEQFIPWTPQFLVVHAVM